MSSETRSSKRFEHRAGGVWDYLSPSRLNTWLACPLKFRRKYVEGICISTSPAAFLGKIVHAGLEHYYRHRQLGITLAHHDVTNWLIGYFPQAAAEDRIIFATAADELKLKTQGTGLVRGYLACLPADEPQPLAVEVPLAAPLIDPRTGEDLGVPLIGIIDLVLPSDRGPLVVDFKTTSRSSSPREITHEIQLSCYAYLLRSASPNPESGLEIRNLIKTKSSRAEFHRYGARTDVHFQRLFNVIRAYLDDLASVRFVFRPSLGCAMCEFREICAAA